MKKILLSLLLLPVFILFSGEKLFIYSTTDIHGKIFRPKTKPDLLKLVQAIRSDAEKNDPDQNLLIDCGDLIQGSYEAQTDHGKIVIDLMNLAGFHVWVPGNHDFDLGFRTLLKRAHDFKGDVLCANLKTQRGRAFPAWKTYRRAGLDVAVIGMTAEQLADWSWKPGAQGYSAEKTIPSLEAVMPEIMRAKPDLIVLAIHAGRFPAARFKAGWNMRSLAERFPQIDLILGGHTHEPVKGLLLAGKVWYVQAGKHSEGYSKIEIARIPGKRNRFSISSAWHPLPENAGSLKIPDPALRKKLFKLRKEMYSTVCRNAPALGASRPEETALFFCDAIREQTGAKIVFHGVLSRADKHAGRYARKDVFDLCPFENTVILAELRPSDIRAILKEQEELRRSRKKFGMPQSVRGIRMNPDGRLYFDDGTPWNDEKKRVTAAFNSFIASSAGMRFPVLKKITWKQESSGRDTKLKVRDILEQYMRRNFQ